MLHLYKKPDFASDFDPKQSIQQLQTTWRSYFSHDEVVQLQEAPRRANAAIVMLARNRELEGAVSSIKQLEDRFNKKFNYPWIFLNDEEFSDEFKRYFHHENRSMSGPMQAWLGTNIIYILGEPQS